LHAKHHTANVLTVDKLNDCIDATIVFLLNGLKAAVRFFHN
jgi:hypothetical protein